MPQNAGNGLMHLYEMIPSKRSPGYRYIKSILSNNRLNHEVAFLKQQILDSSKLKDFADDNFEFDENG